MNQEEVIMYPECKGCGNPLIQKHRKWGVFHNACCYYKKLISVGVYDVGYRKNTRR